VTTDSRKDESPRAYEPARIEEHWYKEWIDRGYFTPQVDPTRNPFTIIMPPPNVTGELHVGHSLTIAIEDAMARWHRMKGDAVLYLPGTDHAGIATQVVVEQQLAKRGLNRHQIGRDAFEKAVWEWVAISRGRITDNLKRFGASCDWTRERFTLDPSPARAVRTTFKKLYDKGLIYRGERLINWCPRCLTALSDLEVQHQETMGSLYYMRYPFADGNGYITVATTRPETYLGDSAVAVNPSDHRFAGIVGRKVKLPFINREIPIIADSAVESSFGTGMVKITPAHDPVDFEMGQRHNLEFLTVMNPDATINELGGPYHGLERSEARRKILEDFQSSGLYDKTEKHTSQIGHCDRCRTVVEPRVSKQWFVRIQPLADPAIEAVRSGSISIVPERFTKVYLNWMENLRDWCISRQLWWGHRIPVWYCSKCGEMTVAVETPSRCARCGAADIIQDPDMLDTWFSSGLWPHSTLGWPDDTEDLRYFYPTSIMETGYDILFFWVARMIMMGIENMGDVPFRTVFLHGLVRDDKGEKMSKMKGNVLNPFELMSKYGTDALRFALTTGTSPGNDVNLSVQRLEAGRNFTNKIWNASRLVLRSLESGETDNQNAVTEHRLSDQWIISRLNRLTANVDMLLNDHQYGEAERQIHDFFWSEFCDSYLEIAKLRIRQGDKSSLPVMKEVLGAFLRLLHPFMPFITEELWQGLRPFLPNPLAEIETIVNAPYPVSEPALIDDGAEKTMDLILDTIRAVRNARAQHKVPPNRPVKTLIYADEYLAILENHAGIIESLAGARPLNILARSERPSDADKTLVSVLNGAEVIIPLAGMVDIAAEKKRLETELAGTKAAVSRLTERLRDETFLAKAPAAVVGKEKDKLAEYSERLSRIQEELIQLDRQGTG
jgi:valyl-tRNA synthetase